MFAIRHAMVATACVMVLTAALSLTASAAEYRPPASQDTAVVTTKAASTARASHRAGDGAPACGCAAGVLRSRVVTASADATATATSRAQRPADGPIRGAFAEPGGT
jgi:hypothetical protein